jgi:predicted CoA-binding protein
LTDMLDLIKEFMAQKRFALVGATDNPGKTGHHILMNLKNRGYEVYPVNPRLEKIDGAACYHSLSDIPVKVDVVDFVVPPERTIETLKECRQLGLNRIWLQPGSENETAIDYCRKNKFKVVYNTCVMQN